MICRLCLLDSEQYKTIFDSKQIEFNIASLVKKYLYLELTPNDEISGYVCNSCWFSLDNFHKFYCIIEEAQNKLSNKIYIKQEVESIDNDDNIRDSINTSFQENNKEKDPLETINEILDKVKHEEIEIYDEENSLNKNNERIEVDNEQVDMKQKGGRHKKTFLESFFEVQDKIEESIEIQSINDESLRGNQESSNDKDSETEYSYNSMEDNETDGNIKAENVGEPTAYTKKYKEIYDTIKKYMKIQCELCPIEFPTFAKLITHYRREHNRAGYIICCNKKFFNPSFLVDHINIHKNPNLFRCELCNKTYPDKKNLKAHNITVHTPEDQKIHKCDVCPKSYPRKYQLETHKLSHIPKEDRKYYCEICGKAFASKHRLQTHINLQHEKVYKKICHICGQEFHTVTLLRKHQLEHEGVDEPKVQCQKCGIWLKSKYIFNVHMKRHREQEEAAINPETFKCNICGKVSATKNTLRSHIRHIHQLKSIYQCNVCSKSFKLPKYLKEHMSIHTGEDLYTCPYCLKTFKFAGNFYTHKKRMHRKEWEEERKNKIPSEMVSTKNIEEKSQRLNETYI